MLRIVHLATFLLAVGFSSTVIVPSLAQQRPIPIAVLNGRDTATVGAFDSLGIRYVDVHALLTLIGAPIIQNDTTLKIEFLAGTNLVRLTHRSPFVIITDRASNESEVYQMQTSAVRRAGRFFLPMRQMLGLFDRVWSGSIAADGQGNVFTLSGSRRAPYDITDVRVERRVNGYLLTILASRPLGDVESWLKPDGWLFVTIAGARADTLALSKFKPFGGIRGLLTFQSPTSVQLTFRLSPDIEQAEVVTEPGTSNLLIALRTKSVSTPKAEPKPEPTVSRDLAQERRRWKLDVIVIDPGHGGKDPGAIGVTGVREKDVTLAVALRLGRLIERDMKDVKVVYTRKTDTFVELYRRTQIANEVGGKLFISLHCNSLDRKPSAPNGFEIYLLRPGKTEDAITIAAKENAVIQFEEGYKDRYKELTEEEFIIITMAQSAYMKYSEQFAELAAESMAEHMQMRNSGVKQAGFYVLVGASMPNVLVELGYISNRKEEQLLKSARGQDRLAEAIFNGIKEYRSIYEKSLQ
jgi:N-acetylmuramoyl-L-alanine amidase